MKGFPHHETTAEKDLPCYHSDKPLLGNYCLELLSSSLRFEFL